MANLHYGDLDLARSKKSSISTLKLSKNHRHNISVNIPPTTSNLKEIKFKTFPHLFTFFQILASTSSEQTMACQEEEEGCLVLLSQVFLGAGERVTRSPPENAIYRDRSPLTRS